MVKMKGKAMNEAVNIEDLSRELVNARTVESDAKAKRVAIEEQIAAQVPTELNKSKTVDCGNGLKITVKRANSYKADLDGLLTLGEDIPAEVLPIKETPPVPAGFAFDEQAYENVMQNHPDVAVKLAPFVEVKPRKVSVSVKVA